ncbi:hypothetical protein COOONC_15883 [Cooperia oncophora]
MVQLLFLTFQFETLQRANELEEAHLHAHVTSVPTPHLWELPSEASNDEVEALLRDVHHTYKTMQEQIDQYSSLTCLNSKHEVIYDTVADDPEPIYDTVADSDIHHAHGAIVLSEPVKRPLAVSPPIYDEVAEDPLPCTEVLHYTETDLSKHQTFYDDDENIYAEIGPLVPGAKVTSDVNANVEKEVTVTHLVNEHVSCEVHHVREVSSDDLVHAKLIHIDYDDEHEQNKTSVAKVNRELDKEHQIIRNLDENQEISPREENVSHSIKETAHVKPTVPDDNTDQGNGRKRG